jgi:hypothetical protein
VDATNQKAKGAIMRTVKEYQDQYPAVRNAIGEMEEIFPRTHSYWSSTANLSLSAELVATTHKKLLPLAVQVAKETVEIIPEYESTLATLLQEIEHPDYLLYVKDKIAEASKKNKSKSDLATKYPACAEILNLVIECDELPWEDLVDEGLSAEKASGVLYGMLRLISSGNSEKSRIVRQCATDDFTRFIADKMQEVRDKRAKTAS